MFARLHHPGMVFFSAFAGMTENIGGSGGRRPCNLLVMSQLLCRLSYRLSMVALAGFEPTASLSYEGSALPFSYRADGWKVREVLPLRFEVQSLACCWLHHGPEKWCPGKESNPQLSE